jgi:hypothetical protein
MAFGIHTSLVEEILTAIANGDILSPHAPIADPLALVIADLDEAKRYAWSRPIAGDDISTWNDLREDEVAPFHALPYERPDLKPAYDSTDTLLEPLSKLLREKLPANYAELRDDVAADLQHCAMNRALHGLLPDSFWERMWQIYRRGGWPCGWEGEYPQGRLVVFASLGSLGPDRSP